MDKIDIVIPWVDPEDDKWFKLKQSYNKNISNEDFSTVRYRDWDNVKYIFRGIEKYCSFINKVYFISSGDMPSWLNPNCDKLVYLKHSDYLPEDYLPTFNAHPIELNLHRIKELSQYFIYFNDDLFITNDVDEKMFFKHNLPVYPAILHVNLANDKNQVIQHIYFNNNLLINKHFTIDEMVNDRDKWFSIKGNGLRGYIENTFNSHYSQIIGFYNSHLPTPFLKSTIEEVWKNEGDLLDSVSRNRFRSKDDVSQYIFRYWDLAKNNFYPINPKKLGKSFNVSYKTIDEICEAIIKQKHRMICINDTEEIVDNDEFELYKNRINEALDKIYPNKSEYER